MRTAAIRLVAEEAVLIFSHLVGFKQALACRKIITPKPHMPTANAMGFLGRPAHDEKKDTDSS